MKQHLFVRYLPPDHQHTLFAPPHPMPPITKYFSPPSPFKCCIPSPHYTAAPSLPISIPPLAHLNPAPKTSEPNFIHAPPTKHFSPPAPTFQQQLHIKPIPPTTPLTPSARPNHTPSMTHSIPAPCINASIPHHVSIHVSAPLHVSIPQNKTTDGGSSSNTYVNDTKEATNHENSAPLPHVSATSLPQNPAADVQSSKDEAEPPHPNPAQLIRSIIHPIAPLHHVRNSPKAHTNTHIVPIRKHLKPPPTKHFNPAMNLQAQELIYSHPSSSPHYVSDQENDGTHAAIPPEPPPFQRQVQQSHADDTTTTPTPAKPYAPTFGETDHHCGQQNQLSILSPPTHKPASFHPMSPPAPPFSFYHPRSEVSPPPAKASDPISSPFPSRNKSSHDDQLHSNEPPILRMPAPLPQAAPLHHVPPVARNTLSNAPTTHGPRQHVNIADNLNTEKASDNPEKANEIPPEPPTKRLDFLPEHAFVKNRGRLFLKRE